MITDEVLLGIVPPAMDKARGGSEARSEARAELVAAYREQEQAGNAYRACVIAHYVGFLSVNGPDEHLRWNQLALGHASDADPSAVATFMPSLLASLGAATLAVGDQTRALDLYEQAASHMHVLGDDAYGSKLRAQIESELERLHAGSGG